MQQEPSSPEPSLSLKELELALLKLQQERDRRNAERSAKGEILYLQLIANEGEDTAAKKRELEAEHRRRNPQDANKIIDWIERIIIEPPPRDPSTEWHGQQVDLEAVAKREAAELEPDRLEPKTYIWISVRHAHPEGEHGGEIREGFYDSFDGKVIVTDTKGKLIGSAADYGNPAAVARDILRTAYDKERPLRGFDIGPIV
jgi:hypothetical protein